MLSSRQQKQNQRSQQQSEQQTKSIETNENVEEPLTQVELQILTEYPSDELLNEENLIIFESKIKSMKE